MFFSTVFPPESLRHVIRTLKASKQGTFHQIHSEKPLLSGRQIFCQSPSPTRWWAEQQHPVQERAWGEGGIKYILMLFAAVRALRKVNTEIIRGPIKRDAGPDWFSWEQSALSTSQKQNRSTLHN